MRLFAMIVMRNVVSVYPVQRVTTQIAQNVRIQLIIHRFLTLPNTGVLIIVQLGSLTLVLPRIVNNQPTPTLSHILLTRMFHGPICRSVGLLQAHFVAYISLR